MRPEEFKNKSSKEVAQIICEKYEHLEAVPVSDRGHYPRCGLIGFKSCEEAKEIVDMIFGADEFNRPMLLVNNGGREYESVYLYMYDDIDRMKWLMEKPNEFHYVCRSIYDVMNDFEYELEVLRDEYREKLEDVEDPDIEKKVEVLKKEHDKKVEDLKKKLENEDFRNCFYRRYNEDFFDYDMIERYGTDYEYDSKHYYIGIDLYDFDYK